MDINRVRDDGHAARPAITGLAGAAAVVAVLIIDAFVISRPAFAENAPMFGPWRLLRIVLLAAASALGVWAVLERRSPGAVRRVRLRAPFDRLAVLAAAAGGVGAVSLLVVAPSYFTKFANEDRPAEWASFLLLMVAAGVILWVVRNLAATHGRSWSLVLPLGLAAGLFVTGMEEVSWFQRVLSVETPEGLEGNIQGELNVHNFATAAFENAYYFGAFVALMVAPFVVHALRVRVSEPLAVFLPAPIVALASAPAFGFNYDMWGITLSQLSFYGSLLIVWYFARALEPDQRWLAWVALGATITVQLVMLTLGDRSERIFDATEYKETFIPFGFAVYAVDVWRRVSGRRESPASVAGDTDCFQPG